MVTTRRQSGIERIQQVAEVASASNQRRSRRQSQSRDIVSNDKADHVDLGSKKIVPDFKTRRSKRTGPSSTDADRNLCEAMSKQVEPISILTTSVPSIEDDWDSVWILDSIEEGIKAFIRCSCVHGLPDSVQERQMDWLKTNWSSFSIYQQQALLASVLVQTESSRPLSELALTRLMIVLMNDLVGRKNIETITRILTRCTRYIDTIIDGLISRWKEVNGKISIPLVLSLIETVGMREGARLIGRLFTCLTEDIIYLSALTNSLSLFDHSAAAAFVIQVIAMHAVKPTVLPNVLSPLIEGISKFFENHVSSETILPCRQLWEIDSGIVRTCISCPPCEVPSNIPREALHKINMFECDMCQSILSSLCPECGSCPMKNICWPCCYRIIASLQVTDEYNVKIQKSTDQTVIGWLLVLAGSGHQRSFITELIPEPVKQSIGTVVYESPRLEIEISNDFAQDLIEKLFIVSRMQAVGHVIVRALIVSSPSVTSLKALCSIVGIDQFEFFLEPVKDLALGIVLGSPGCAKTLSGAITLLASLHTTILPSMITDITSVLSHMSLANRRLVITKLVQTNMSSLDVTDSVLQYIFFDERWDNEYTLFDAFLDCLCKYWLNSNDTAHFVHVVSLIGTNMVFQPRLMAKLDQCVLEKHICHLSKEEYIQCQYLLKSQIYIFSSHTLNHIVPIVIENKDWSGLAMLIEHSNALSENPVHARTLVTKELLPILIGGSSSSVHAVCQVLKGFVIMKNPAIDQQYIDQISNQFLSLLSNPNTSESKKLRSAWILSSLSSLLPNCVKQQTISIVIDWARTSPGTLIAPLGYMCGGDSSLEFAHTVELLLKTNETVLQLRALDAILYVMKSSLLDTHLSTSIDILPSTRPDGGVRCRCLSVLFNIIVSEKYWFSDNPLIVAKSIEAIHLMDKLGIVNRRILPPLFLIRYVVSLTNNDVTKEVQDDTMDINMYAWHLFVQSDKLSNSVVHSVLSELKGKKFSIENTANAAYRLIEYLFPISDGRKEKHAIFVLINEILNYQSQIDSYSAILVASILCACVVLSDEKNNVLERARNLAIFQDTFVHDFLIVELHRTNCIRDRFSYIADIVQRFMMRELVSEPPVEIAVSKKRRRSSNEGPSSTIKKKQKRKTISQLAEGSSDSEYTDGGPAHDSSDNEEF